MRYDYARAKSRDRIESILEDCYAAGEVSPAERPKIEARKDHRGRITYYALTLDDNW